MEPLKLSHVLPIVVIGALVSAGLAWLVMTTDPMNEPGEEWVSGLLVSERLQLKNSRKYISIYVGEQGEFARETGMWSLNDGSIQLSPDDPNRKTRWLRNSAKYGCNGLRAVDSKGVAIKTTYDFYFRPGTC